jgi:hypothetical protein
MKYIKAHNNLKTFDESLSNKKHLHIFPNLPMTLNFMYHFFIEMQHFLPLNNIKHFFCLESLYNFMFLKVISMLKCKQSTSN